MTGAPDGNRRQDGPRDRWIPWMFVAFFGVVVAANGIMVYFAMASFTGLQTQDTYRKGLDYNATLAAERAQDALGWTVVADFTEHGAQGGLLSVRVADGDGAPLDDATVSARLVRPTQSGYDRDIALAPAGAGLYEAEVDLPLAGQWEIRTRIQHGSDEYRTERRIVTQ